MSLSPGTRLGAYEILGLLAKGFLYKEIADMVMAKIAELAENDKKLHGATAGNN